MARAEAPVPAGGHVIEVEVVYCPGRAQVDARTLHLPPGATVAHAHKARRQRGPPPRRVGCEVGGWGPPQPPTPCIYFFMARMLIDEATCFEFVNFFIITNEFRKRYSNAFLIS